jgi:glutathione S-transferase
LSKIIVNAMSNIILHHYPTSPFSEKVRLILGYKSIPWQSVFIPQIMPKPDVVALTGGYRRTPFMQIGADIYCDSALICSELERRYPSPSLYPAGVAHGLVDTLAQWGDTTLFWQGAIGYAFQSKSMPFIFAGLPPEAAKAFAADRAAMRPGAPRVATAEHAGSLRVFLQRIDSMLESSAYLLSSTPSLADFSVYHPLWFIRRIEPVAAILAGVKNVLPWMDRMATIGHGKSSKLSSAEAVTAAASSSAEAFEAPSHDEHGIKAGERVCVTPLDYALDAVAGELVACAANELVIRRTDDRAGTVVVHFPRVGYKLERLAEQ